MTFVALVLRGGFCHHAPRADQVSISPQPEAPRRGSSSSSQRRSLDDRRAALVAVPDAEAATVRRSLPPLRLDPSRPSGSRAFALPLNAGSNPLLHSEAPLASLSTVSLEGVHRSLWLSVPCPAATRTPSTIEGEGGRQQRPGPSNGAVRHSHGTTGCRPDNFRSRIGVAPFVLRLGLLMGTRMAIWKLGGGMAADKHYVCVTVSLHGLGGRGDPDVIVGRIKRVLAVEFPELELDHDLEVELEETSP